MDLDKGVWNLVQLAWEVCSLSLPLKRFHPIAANGSASHCAAAYHAIYISQLMYIKLSWLVTNCETAPSSADQ